MKVIHGKSVLAIVSEKRNFAWSSNNELINFYYVHVYPKRIILSRLLILNPVQTTRNPLDKYEKKYVFGEYFVQKSIHHENHQNHQQKLIHTCDVSWTIKTYNFVGSLSIIFSYAIYSFLNDKHKHNPFYELKNWELNCVAYRRCWPHDSVRQKFRLILIKTFYQNKRNWLWRSLKLLYINFF